MHAIRSLSFAPLAAAKWLPVCRKSWTCRPSAPMDRTAYGRHLVEVAAAQQPALDPGKDERARIALDEGGQVLVQGRDDRARDADDAPTGLRLGWPDQQLPGQAAPLRGAGSGAPRAGLWPWEAPARRARAVPAGGRHVDP